MSLRTSSVSRPVNLDMKWTYVCVAFSSSLALIMMLVVLPKERFMRGGQVMIRLCGRENRWPFFPAARIIAALPKAWPTTCGRENPACHGCVVWTHVSRRQYTHQSVDLWPDVGHGVQDGGRLGLKANSLAIDSLRTCGMDGHNVGAQLCKTGQQADTGMNLPVEFKYRYTGFSGAA
jgi:hypothetical protein